MSDSYTTAFFEELKEGMARSAAVIVPLVVTLIQPMSVVDVGCGEGIWLAAFRSHGVTDVLGIDGSYVDRRRLQIDADRFQAADLAKPLLLPRQFDLAVSLEVAEHLPPESASTFVASLVRLAPVVLFSAAIPFQGGTHHVNEQWPDAWAELFREHGYLPLDCIRRQIWWNEFVEISYRQNVMLFAKGEVLQDNPLLRDESEKSNLQQLSVVHPSYFLNVQGAYQAALAREACLRAMPASGLKQASRIWLSCLKNAIVWRFRARRNKAEQAQSGEQRR